MRLRYRLIEAAEMLSVSKTQVEKLLRDGKLTAQTDGPNGDRYISHQCLVDYVADRDAIGVQRRAG